jgi:hypothetical protein
MSSPYTPLASVFNLAGPDLLIIFAIFFITIPFVIWMVVDCAVHESSENNLKLVWLLVILFAPCGSLIYFFVRKISRPSPPPLPR